MLATQGVPRLPVGWWVAGHEMGSNASKGIWGWWLLVTLAQHSREKGGPREGMEMGRGKRANERGMRGTRCRDLLAVVALGKGD